MEFPQIVNWSNNPQKGRKIKEKIKAKWVKTGVPNLQDLIPDDLRWR